ncbi:MAG: putative thioesterase, partial [Planctomycetota bacterium]
MGHEHWFPFRTPRPAATVRLACLAHAGGGASVFREWPKSLPSWIEVAPVQLPGHETRLREPLVGEVSALAAPIADALESLPQL